MPAFCGNSITKLIRCLYDVYTLFYTIERSLPVSINKYACLFTERRTAIRIKYINNRKSQSEYKRMGTLQYLIIMKLKLFSANLYRHGRTTFRVSLSSTWTQRVGLQASRRRRALRRSPLLIEFIVRFPIRMEIGTRA